MFSSQHCIHVLVICADHNYFDVPMFDVSYICRFFFYVMTLDFVVSK
jgi:hypothetical protein